MERAAAVTSHLEQYEQDLRQQIQDREREDLRKILDLPEGRRFVWSILETAGIYGRAFTGEALSMAFNEGRREIGITLLEKIEGHAQGSFLIMQREALNEKELHENGRRLAAAKDEGEANV